MAQRKNFGKLQAVIAPPDLIELQSQSYKDFLQEDCDPEKRKHAGLQAVFKEVFPIESYDSKYFLDFVKYELTSPKHSYIDTLRDGGTYSIALNVTFRLKDGDEIREDKVYMGEIPLMTPTGSFVINGAERVVVSQLHRSPGICSEKSIHQNGDPLYSMRVIPDRGSWIEIQFDTSNLIWIYVDRRRRRRKFLATTFLRALGYGSDEELLDLYYEFADLDVTGDYEEEELADFVFSDDVLDIDSQNVIARKYEILTPVSIQQLRDAGFTSVRVVDISWDGGLILESIKADSANTTDDALKDIYQKLRPGDPATVSNARQLLKRQFFDAKRYDLGIVGRHKINKKLGLEGKIPNTQRILDVEDVIETLRMLVDIRKGDLNVDDIDHLGSRRVRTVGELVENQCRVGLSRTERLVRERMTLYDASKGAALTPSKLVNSKSLSAVVQDFFARSQLSQFMDQTNPLSELAHKRRLSALGPGGLSRDRAGFEVRDVHLSHYGRICPIETPEGPNIGLISSLATYARRNEFGFIETPYLKVKKGVVSRKVDYLSADEEEKYIIAQANAPMDENREFVNKTVACRYQTEMLELQAGKVQYMDVSPKQITSVAAGLIPFLEHDDANRALMGANMMRQAVPLIKTERPYVATGMESLVAKDSRSIVTADIAGKVAHVDALNIIITKDGKMPADENDSNSCQKYKLQKFFRSNAATCINQKPIVKVGDSIKAGDAIADGPATDQGELALGKNLLVAFMPWDGYNFEDAILISERILKDDVFTSVHITSFECGARDTKLGQEEITRDIPNVGENALKDLNEEGIIYPGARVVPGDILVGKITPKSETELAPEERLLRAIFGEKAAEVRDTSLTVPSGTSGVVMDVRVTTHQRDMVKEDSAEKKNHVKNLKDVHKKARLELMNDLTDALSNILLGEKIPLEVVNAQNGEIIIPSSRKITKTLLRKLANSYEHIQIESSPIQEKIDDIIAEFSPKFEELDEKHVESVDKVESGDDIDSGIVKQVKVYVADKKKISVGDKLSGRHGNKGVISRIVSECDMPYMPDGKPVDIVLNPLGVPSRMNLGQVFETHLGMACDILGLYAGTPIFDGIKEKTISELLEKAGCDFDGKTYLYDGRTGERFDQRVVVGQIYMLKLHHLVSDKLHARSVGPYSLVTQQPLGGKAQHGGQRMGEMEVWALEAYGVAYALQELLTVKSDDVVGRTKIYESIVKGENVLDAGMPESFSVLISELRGLCLNIEPHSKDEDKLDLI
jgi:DNA-directed RNA polymerase subunit beta